VDSVFVIGSAVAGYLLLGLHAALDVPVMVLWWVWSVGFDGTHIFATATRTFFDHEARATQGTMLWGSLGFFFAIGPLLVLAGLKGWLALAVGVWAYYHVLRQHFGFMMLYKVKNHDLETVDNRWDSRFLYLMLAFPPFHRFFVHHPEELGIPKGAALAGMSPLVEPALWGGIGLMVAGYGLRQWRKWQLGRDLNAPKLCLLAAVVPLHWLTFHFLSWQAAVPTVTIVHNLQYHAIVWFYNRNRYAEERDGRRRFGWLPPAVSRSLLTYVGLGLVFSLAYRVPGYELGRMSDLAFGFFCGFGLTHYYLDGRIWRVRQDPGLRRYLGMG
jgi:hypothetical protein